MFNNIDVGDGCSKSRSVTSWKYQNVTNIAVANVYFQDLGSWVSDYFWADEFLNDPLFPHLPRNWQLATRSLLGFPSSGQAAQSLRTPLLVHLNCFCFFWHFVTDLDWRFAPLLQITWHLSPLHTTSWAFFGVFGFLPHWCHWIPLGDFGSSILFQNNSVIFDTDNRSASTVVTMLNQVTRSQDIFILLKLNETLISQFNKN